MKNKKKENEEECLYGTASYLFKFTEVKIFKKFFFADNYVVTLALK